MSLPGAHTPWLDDTSINVAPLALLSHRCPPCSFNPACDLQECGWSSWVGLPMGGPGPRVGDSLTAVPRDTRVSSGDPVPGSSAVGAKPASVCGGGGGGPAQGEGSAHQGSCSHLGLPPVAVWFGSGCPPPTVLHCLSRCPPQPAPPPCSRWEAWPGTVLSLDGPSVTQQCPLRSWPRASAAQTTT